MGDGRQYENPLPFRIKTSGVASPFDPILQLYPTARYLIDSSGGGEIGGRRPADARRKEIESITWWRVVRR
jgi:hypothetical protein